MPRRTGDAIAKEILNYFLRNPRAADNLEGVARWRLLSETIHRNVKETHLALEWLSKQEFLVKVSTPGSGDIFTLNHEKRFLAEALVRQGEDTDNETRM